MDYSRISQGTLSKEIDCVCFATKGASLVITVNHHPVIMTAGEDEGDILDNVSDDNPNDDDEAKARKRKERLEQNRISARESRKRKKTMIEELQRTVITLSRENKELNERNEQLRRQLMEIGAKVCVSKYNVCSLFRRHIGSR